MIVFYDKNRIAYLDFLKGIAITSVILLHALPPSFLTKAFACFHISHAVPIFLFVAGITSYISYEKSSNNSFRYQINKSITSSIKLFCPYILFCLAILLFRNEPFRLKNILYGQLGPGGYFPLLFIQHLFIFPFIVMFYKKTNNKNKFLIILFLCSAMLEWACLSIDISAKTYRILWIRYIYVACLGLYFYNNSNLNKLCLTFFALISSIYIYMTCYHELQIPFIPAPEWSFQHYPAYFYTLFLCSFLSKIAQSVQFYHTVSFLGKNSYYIFLSQMFLFSTFYPTLNTSLPLKVVFALLFSISTGILVNLLSSYLKLTKIGKYLSSLEKRFLEV